MTLLRFWVIRHGVIPASRGGKLKTAAAGPRDRAVPAAAVRAAGHGRGRGDGRWRWSVTVVTGADYVWRALHLRRTSDRAAAQAGPTRGTHRGLSRCGSRCWRSAPSWCSGTWSTRNADLARPGAGRRRPGAGRVRHGRRRRASGSSRRCGAALDRADAVVVTGGLGPTTDDLTREALARLAGRPAAPRRRPGGRAAAPLRRAGAGDAPGRAGPGRRRGGCPGCCPTPSAPRPGCTSRSPRVRSSRSPGCRARCARWSPTTCSRAPRPGRSPPGAAHPDAADRRGGGVRGGGRAGGRRARGGGRPGLPGLGRGGPGPADHPGRRPRRRAGAARAGRARRAQPAGGGPLRRRRGLGDLRRPAAAGRPRGDRGGGGVAHRGSWSPRGWSTCPVPATCCAARCWPTRRR